MTSPAAKEAGTQSVYQDPAETWSFFKIERWRIWVLPLPYALRHGFCPQRLTVHSDSQGAPGLTFLPSVAGYAHLFQPVSSHTLAPALPCVLPCTAMLRLPSGSSARRGVTDTSVIKLIPPIIYSHDTDEEFNPTRQRWHREGEGGSPNTVEGQSTSHFLSLAIIASRSSAPLLKCDFREGPSLPSSLVCCRPAEARHMEPAEWITAFIS